MRTIELLPEAARVVTGVVESVPFGSWSRPSPCAGWTVRDVLNHLVSEHLWAPRLLAGETLAQVGASYDGDLLGADPVAAWRSACARSMLAWASADPGGQVHTSMGLLAVGEYAHQMLIDLTVHAWDIARGAGMPMTPVADAVEDGLTYETPRVASGGVAGIFAPPLRIESEVPFDRLLAMLGRDPAWS